MRVVFEFSCTVGKHGLRQRKRGAQPVHLLGFVGGGGGGRRPFSMGDGGGGGGRRPSSTGLRSGVFDGLPFSDIFYPILITTNTIVRIAPIRKKSPARMFDHLIAASNQ